MEKGIYKYLEKVFIPFYSKKKKWLDLVKKIINYHSGKFYQKRVQKFILNYHYNNEIWKKVL